MSIGNVNACQAFAVDCTLFGNTPQEAACLLSKSQQDSQFSLLQVQELCRSHSTSYSLLRRCAAAAAAIPAASMCHYSVAADMCWLQHTYSCCCS